jgi:hypothetical protein
MNSRQACQGASIVAGFAGGATFAWSLIVLEDGLLAIPFLGEGLIVADIGAGLIAGTIIQRGAAEVLGCGPSGRPGREGNTRQEEKLSLSIPMMYTGVGLSTLGAIQRLNVKKGETNRSGFIPALSGLGLTIAGLLYLLLPRKNDQPI